MTSAMAPMNTRPLRRSRRAVRSFASMTAPKLLHGGQDAMNGVVGVAADVPRRRERRLVALGVAAARTQLMVARRRVPDQVEAPPRELADRRVELGGRPARATVRAHVDGLDRRP